MPEEVCFRRGRGDVFRGFLLKAAGIFVSPFRMPESKGDSAIKWQIRHLPPLSGEVPAEGRRRGFVDN